MLVADLYVDKIDLARYLTPAEAAAAGAGNAVELAARLKRGALKPEDCRAFTPVKRYALSLALKAAEVLPQVQSLELPRPVSAEIFEINARKKGTPVAATVMVAPDTNGAHA